MCPSRTHARGNTHKYVGLVASSNSPHFYFVGLLLWNTSGSESSKRGGNLFSITQGQCQCNHSTYKLHVAFLCCHPRNAPWACVCMYSVCICVCTVLLPWEDTFTPPPSLLMLSKLHGFHLGLCSTKISAPFHHDYRERMSTHCTAQKGSERGEWMLVLECHFRHVFIS